MIGRSWALAWNRWRAALRLARRDAARHRIRTVLSTLLVALPIAALVAGIALLSAAPPARDVALAGIPDGAQAVITATAITHTNAPFAQVPEGAPGPWVDDLEQVPASEDDLAASLASGSQLLPYWNVPQVLVTTATVLAPGEETTAGVGIDEETDLAGIAATQMQEAGGEALSLLLPTFESGTAPTNNTEIVVTAALAQRLNLAVSDEVAVIAPPSTGWHSTDGRIGDAVQDAQRGYRVSGIVQGAASQVWAQEGWISRLVAADAAGIDGHWLVVGDDPVTWEQAISINKLQAFAVSRHVLTNYPSSDELYPVPVSTNAVLAQVAGILLTGALGSALVLLLITPAFTVSTDQSRRTLGLAAATGATPADLRRIVNAQGLVIGAGGGTLGAALGITAAFLADLWIPQQRDLANTFPWWIVPVGIGIAMVLGLVATLIPAAKAARLNPVDALKDRATPPHPSSVRNARLRAISAPVALAGSVAAGMLGLANVSDVSDEHASPGTISASAMPAVILLLLTLVLAVAGILLLVRLLPQIGARLAAHLPIAPRLALRDAAEHRSRFVSAATAVLIAACAASYLIVAIGSTTANDRDNTGEMVQNGHFILGAQVPVSDAVDRLVITDAITMLKDSVAITGHEPIYSPPLHGADSALHFAAVQPLGRECPAGLIPDTASAVTVDAPLMCTTWERGYTPSLSIPWWGGSDAGILGGDALRASGLDGAVAAAGVLENGGVVVNNAAWLSANGTVRIAISTDVLPNEENAERFVELPGTFLRGFAFAATISPATADELGVTDWEYVGEAITTSRELSPAQLDETRALINQHTSLVRMAEPQTYRPWGRDIALVPVALLAALAVAAAAISLLLAKTQTARDVSTMHAVGASARFLRRFALSQGLVILATGLPLGIIAGISLGGYQIAWNRATGIGGAWLETVPLWGLQSALALVIIAASLCAVLIVGRPTLPVTRRGID